MRHTAHAAKREARPDGGAVRRLDRTREEAILRAAIEALSEVGFDRLTMDEIAARARAGKSTLYRRWPSKAELVLDAVRAWNESLDRVLGAAAGPPGTGSLRGDIEAAIEAVPTGETVCTRWLAVLAGLVTAVSGDPGLAAALARPLLEPPRRYLGDLLRCAAARGEISAACPVDLMPELVVGVVLMRLVAGEIPDRAFLRRIVDEVVLPLVGAGPIDQAAGEGS